MKTYLLTTLCCFWTILTTLAPAATQTTPEPPGKEWWYHPHKDHTPSGPPGEIEFKKYDGYYLGDTERKAVYLTFDAGSETGCTARILDVLKDNGVRAAFFVTRYYMKEAPELVKRMVAEGHVVGNHSATHPRLGTKKDAEIEWEITAPAEYFRQLTGREMAPLFRPPCGECDERILRTATTLGYRTIFWSMAYEDWLPQQKGEQYAMQFVMKYHHPGAIILLHPYASNTAALDAIIKGLKGAGYEFGSLLDVKE